MATNAEITINGTPGSNTDLPVNTLVQLDNVNAGGETTWTWTIVDQPAGPADALSNPAITNPTITPTKEGTYLFQLIVNQGIAGEKSDRQEGAIRQLKTRIRVPAAQEVAQAGARGWAGDTDVSLQLLDSVAADANVITARAGGVLLVGQTVQLNDESQILTGLPGAQFLPGANPASGASALAMRQMLGIMLGKVGVGGAAVLNDLVQVRLRGYYRDITSYAPGVFAVGDPVWVGTGPLGRSNIPGPNPRILGRVVATRVLVGPFQGISLVLDGTPSGAQTVEIVYTNAAPADGTTIFKRKMTTPILFPLNLAGSQASVGTAPGAATTCAFDIKKNGAAAFATLTFDDTGAPTFVCAAETLFAAGDLLTVVGTGMMNGAADFLISLLGS